MFQDERKEIERLIIQNGGQYSADLTKKCSHLVSDISFSLMPLVFFFFFSFLTDANFPEFLSSVIVIANALLVWIHVVPIQLTIST